MLYTWEVLIKLVASENGTEDKFCGESWQEEVHSLTELTRLEGGDYLI